MKDKLELAFGFIKNFLLPILLVVVGWGWYNNQKELVETKTTLKTERSERATERKVAKENKVTLEKIYTRTINTAVSDYTNWVKQQKPIILQSVNTVREYAKTDAGKSLCLDADGVRRFSEQRALIFPEYTISPQGSERAVSTTSTITTK